MVNAAKEINIKEANSKETNEEKDTINDKKVKERKIDLAMEEIRKLEQEVNSCSPNTPQLVFRSMKLMENCLFYECKEMSYETYSAKIRKIDNLATKFRRNCTCHRKRK